MTANQDPNHAGMACANWSGEGGLYQVPGQKLTTEHCTDLKISAWPTCWVAVCKTWDEVKRRQYIILEGWHPISVLLTRLSSSGQLSYLNCSYSNSPMLEENLRKSQNLILSLIAGFLGPDVLAGCSRKTGQEAPSATSVVKASRHIREFEADRKKDSIYQ